MKFAIFSLLLFSTLTYAAEKVYKIKETAYIVELKEGILANRGCLTNTEKCQAYQAAKKSPKLSKKSDTSGKNPYSVHCAEVLKGEVVIGTDPDGHENAFCLFPDRSIISCSSLNQF